VNVLKQTKKYNLLKFVELLSNYLENLAGITSTISLTLMVIVVLMGVFSRYIFNNPLLWTEELARYLMIWMAFIAIITACKTNDNIALLSIRDLLPKKIQVIIKYFNRFLIIFFLYIIAVYGYSGALRGMKQVSASLNVPLGIFFMIVPISAILVIVQIIFMMIIELLRYKESKSIQFDHQIGNSKIDEKEWLM
jgi:TRAP-type C4-dicarboxylate transport system permease small subunit